MEKGCFWSEIARGNQIKWSRCSTTKILGLNWPFLMILENDFLLQKRQNWKIERCAFILAMHEWKSTNHTSYMISNECPSIWDQSGLFSSILSEMKAQQTQQKSWNNLKKSAKFIRSNTCWYFDNLCPKIEELFDVHARKWIPIHLGPTTTF